MKLSPEERERIFGERSGAIEQVAPGFHDKHLVLAHMQRYIWAARLVGGLSVTDLDVGCGTVYGLRILQERASQVVGLDRSYDAFVILCLVHKRGDLIWQVCS